MMVLQTAEYSPSVAVSRLWHEQVCMTLYSPDQVRHHSFSPVILNVSKDYHHPLSKPNAVYSPAAVESRHWHYVRKG